MVSGGGVKSSTPGGVLLWYPHIRFQRILAYKHPKICILTVLLVKCGSRTSLSRKVFALPHLLCDIMARAVSAVLYLLLTACNGLPISLRFLISVVIFNTILQVKR